MGATAAGGRRGAACGLATSTRPRAGREPPLREVRGSTLGAGTLHLTDWESGRAGTGRGPIVDRRPSSSGRKAWGRPCGGGEGVWGRCGNSSLPGHGPTGVGAVGGAGPRGGPRPSRHPGRSRTRAGGAGAGLGPAPAARGRHPELLVRRWSAGRGREPRVGRDQQRTRAEGEWGLTGGRAGHSGDNPE